MAPVILVIVTYRPDEVLDEAVPGVLLQVGGQLCFVVLAVSNSTGSYTQAELAELVGVGRSTSTGLPTGCGLDRSNRRALRAHGGAGARPRLKISALLKRRPSNQLPASLDASFGTLFGVPSGRVLVW